MEKDKKTAAVNRLLEEKLYEQALDEIESGIRRGGLWAKALQKSRGNEQAARGLYIEYRFQSIKDEAEIAESLPKMHSNDSKAILMIMCYKVV